MVHSRRGMARVILMMLVAILFLVPTVAQAREKPVLAPEPVTEVVETLTLQRVGSSEVVTQSYAAQHKPGEAISFSLDLVELTKVADAQITAPQTSYYESCYVASPSWALYGNTGMQNWAYYNIYWCSTYGVISNVSNFWCSGSAGSGWQYNGCSVWTTTGPGGVGYGVYGSWTYQWGTSWWAIYRTISVSSMHYTNGYYQGMWWTG